MVTQTLPPAASHALVEANTMASSILALAEHTIQEHADGEAFAFLEAISACAQRITAAVTPVLNDAVMEEVSHG